MIPATADQQPILANLLELYCYEFSAFFPIEIGPDGRFDYPNLPLWWNGADHYPFLVRIDGKLAGFALVKREADGVWDVAEFFVLRSYRRRGVGLQVAHEVWRIFPGPWQIRVMEVNASGVAFWERAIAAFKGEAIESVPFEKGGARWRKFRFESGGTSEPAGQRVGKSA